MANCPSSVEGATTKIEDGEGAVLVTVTAAQEAATKEIRERCLKEGRPYTKADLYQAIMIGAVERVRPKMMTVVAIMAGLLPIMWSTGTGSEVMQRIAVPMIGGMVSSTLLTLMVIPAIYGVVKGWRLPAGERLSKITKTEDAREEIGA